MCAITKRMLPDSKNMHTTLWRVGQTGGDCCSSVVSYSFDNVQRHTRKAALYRSSSQHHVQVACIAVGRSSRTKEGKPSSKGAWPSVLSDRGSSFMFVIYNELFAAHHSHKKPLWESLKHSWERVERGSSLKPCWTRLDHRRSHHITSGLQARRR